MIVFLLFLKFEALAQTDDFEGTIQFSFSQAAKSEYGKTSETYLSFIKMGCNKQVYNNSSHIEWFMYLDKPNRLYCKLPQKDTIFYFDCSKEDRNLKIKKIYKLSQKKNILGHDCNQLIVESTMGKETYYYSPQLKLNPQYFSRYRLWGRNVVCQNAQSVFLETSSDNGSIIEIHKATKIDRKKIDDRTFELPDLPQKQVN